MARTAIRISSAMLKASLGQLTAITHEAYNEQIQQVALDTWDKHLQPQNPQWKFVTAKPFFIKDEHGSAHVMAMIDKRLPGIGYVGYFACTNSTVGAQVLELASEWLKTAKGLHDIYGPINGTLPSDYRLNLSDDYAFPGEPVNPAWHIDAFRKAGFRVFNRYASGKLKYYQLLLKLAIRKPRPGYSHLSVRPFDNTSFQNDFETYHELRNRIFPHQSIYCPEISLEERLYNSPGKFDPNYTYFLIDDDRAVGFIMAYAFQKQLVLKTIGLLPEYRGQRLSGLLLKPVHEQAAREGLKTAIYGMVREGNRVHQTKHPLAKVFRRYVTMHKHIN